MFIFEVLAMAPKVSLKSSDFTCSNKKFSPHLCDVVLYLSSDGVYFQSIFRAFSSELRLKASYCDNTVKIHKK